MTDPIADMLARIKNGLGAHKTEVMVPHSNLKFRLATILVEEGYISGVEKDETVANKPELRLTLKYAGTVAIIKSIRRISTPGRRVYAPAGNLPYVYDNLGIAVISTSKGLMTNKKARSQKLGGEVICEIF